MKLKQKKNIEEVYGKREKLEDPIMKEKQILFSESIKHPEILSHNKVNLPYLKKVKH